MREICRNVRVKARRRDRQWKRIMQERLWDEKGRGSGLVGLGDKEGEMGLKKEDRKRDFVVAQNTGRSMPRYTFNDIIYNAIPHLDSIALCDRSRGLGVHLGRASKSPEAPCRRHAGTPLDSRRSCSDYPRLCVYSFYFASFIPSVFTVFISFHLKCEYNSSIIKIVFKTWIKSGWPLGRTVNWG